MLARMTVFLLEVFRLPWSAVIALMPSFSIKINEGNTE